MYALVSLHAAGCLPDSEPVVFRSLREAWEHVASELEFISDDADYLTAHTALHVTDFEQPGIIPAEESGNYRYTVEPFACGGVHESIDELIGCLPCADFLNAFETE